MALFNNIIKPVVLTGLFLGSYTFVRYFAIRNSQHTISQVPTKWGTGIASLYWQFAVWTGHLDCPICHPSTVVMFVKLLPSAAIQISSHEVLWSCNGQC